MSTLKKPLIAIAKAMIVAINQNQCDMVMTGEELRACEKALNDAIAAIDDDDIAMYGAKQKNGVAR